MYNEAEKLKGYNSRYSRTFLEGTLERSLGTLLHLGSLFLIGSCDMIIRLLYPIKLNKAKSCR